MVTARRERQTGQSASCWRWAARLPDRDAPARHAWATGQLTSARLTTPTSSRYQDRTQPPKHARSSCQCQQAASRYPPRKAQEYRHWAPRPRSPAPRPPGRPGGPLSGCRRIARGPCRRRCIAYICGGHPGRSGPCRTQASGRHTHVQPPNNRERGAARPSGIGTTTSWHRTSHEQTPPGQGSGQSTVGGIYNIGPKVDSALPGNSPRCLRTARCPAGG